VGLREGEHLIHPFYSLIVEDIEETLTSIIRRVDADASLVLAFGC